MSALPSDIIMVVANNLSVFEAGRLMRVSKKYYRVIEKLPRVKEWRTLIKTQSLNNCFIIALQENEIDVARSIEKRGDGLFDWDDALSAACQLGKIEIVEWIIDRGAKNWKKGLLGAALGGHRELMTVMENKMKLERYADDYIKDVILNVSCGGHADLLLKMFIQYGPTQDNINCAFIGACRGGHFSFAEGLFYNCNVTNSSDVVSAAIKGASASGHLKLVDWILKSLPIRSEWTSILLESALIGACEGGSVEVFDMITNFVTIEKSHTYTYYMYRPFRAACANGNHILVRKTIDSGVLSWGDGLLAAAGGGHLDLVKYFLDRGAQNWNEAIEAARVGFNMDIVKYLIAERWRRTTETTETKKTWYQKVLEKLKLKK